VSTYPKPLGDDNFYDNSEDLIDLWSLKTMFEGDVPMMDEFITDYMNKQLEDHPDMPVDAQEKFKVALSADIDLLKAALEETTKEFHNVEKSLKNTKGNLLKKIRDDQKAEQGEPEDDGEFMDEVVYSEEL